MEKHEVAKLLYVVKATYINHYRNFTETETKNLLEAWFSVLCDYSYELACAGLKAYLANDTKGFPPVPGQIIDQISKLTTKKELLSEGDAWNMTYKALCNGLYGAEEEFAKLPPVVRRAIGSPEMLRSWAGTEADNISVIQSNFLRAYRIEIQRTEEESKIPDSVKQLIARMNGVALLEENQFNDFPHREYTKEDYEALERKKLLEAAGNK